MRKYPTHLAFLLALIVLGGALTPTAAAQRPSRAELIKQYMKKRKEVASDDAEGNYKLGLWCQANLLERRARRHFQMAVKIDPNHEKARKQLGHVFREGKWLTPEDLEELEKEKKAEEMAARGLVFYEGKWIPKADADRLKAGMVKVEGRWYTPKEAKMLKRGYIRHPETSEWIKKRDLDKAKKGLFPVGRSWVTLEQANEHHSKWENRWQLRTEHYVIHTNLPWQEAKAMKNRVELIYKRIQDLACGIEPAAAARRMNVFIFATQSDYNNYGSQNGTAYSSVYGGWFSLADRDKLMPAVCYWDKNFGRINLPHAMAYQYFYLLFLEAGYNKLEKRNLTQVDLPQWILPGAAAYSDRFWDQGLRKWGANMIIKGGGLASYDKSWFDGYSIMADFARASEHNIKNAGFLVCYIQHGGDKQARELWREVFLATQKEATPEQRRELLGEKFKALEGHLVENRQKVADYFQRVQTGG